jgi:hypothetical protein
MNNNLPTIIIPAYRRGNSLFRLLESINTAHFPSKDIRLIISIEKNATKDVLKVAEKFIFNSGIKEIVQHKTQLGLKNHILWCGNQTANYGSVIVLEDDLIVDSNFYNYAFKSSKFYGDNDSIAGISLYAPTLNEYSGQSFYPMRSKYSTYFINSPSSWGQLWTYKMWGCFITWYNKNGKCSLQDFKIPEKIKAWPDSSWKKYQAAYLASHNKYYVYPYQSYSTHCADEGGTHIPVGTNIFQVPLGLHSLDDDNFCFQDFSPNSILYDSYYEISAKLLSGYLGVSSQQLEVDLQGIKPSKTISNKYIISQKPIASPLKIFSSNLLPIENNIIFKATPKGPFIYFGLNCNVIQKTSIHSKKTSGNIAKKLMKKAFSLFRR